MSRETEHKINNHEKMMFHKNNSKRRALIQKQDIWNEKVFLHYRSKLKKYPSIYLNFLPQLPWDVTQIIVFLLDFKDLMSMRIVCVYWHRMFSKQAILTTYSSLYNKCKVEHSPRTLTWNNDILQHKSCYSKKYGRCQYEWMKVKQKVPSDNQKQASFLAWLFIRNNHKWPVYYLVILFECSENRLYVDIIQQMLEYCQHNFLWDVPSIEGDFRELNFIPHGRCILSGSWNRPHFKKSIPRRAHYLLSFNKYFLPYKKNNQNCVQLCEY